MNKLTSNDIAKTLKSLYSNVPTIQPNVHKENGVFKVSFCVGISKAQLNRMVKKLYETYEGIEVYWSALTRPELGIENWYTIYIDEK